MNQEDITELWHKVWPDSGAFVRASAEDLERFAALVAAAEREKLRDEMWEKAMKLVSEATKFEREACAKVCEQCSDPLGYANLAAEACAAAIRARSNT